MPYFATPGEAEAAFYRAFDTADLDALMAVWAEDEDIVCIHPMGERLTGHDDVKASWHQVLGVEQPMRVNAQWQQTFQTQDLVVHLVKEEIVLEGDKPQRGVVLATNVYRRGEQGWHMIMHHGSPLPATAAAQESADTLH